jgi:phosphatidate cytidylyltransferase
LLYFFIFCYYSFEIHKVEGPIFFFFIVSICFFSDIGGYVIGNLIGGKKLSKISPNKTISGTLGSFIFSVMPLFLFSNFDNINFEINLNHVLFSLIISLINQLGDLFISFFKRKAKIKDMGTLLPGHGGVLDRVDGIIFAIPFSYILLKLI